MSERLGISRVAVWKHIKSLQQMGYAIEGSASGYSLEDDIDHLYSWEFSSSRDNYITFKNLDSTMNIAREKADKGCPSFTTIIAETQNAGKGSADRIWHSNEGGLYFTMVLKPELPSAYHYIYTLAATAALKKTIEKLYNISTGSKWPNDLMYQDKKIAGILTEMHSKGNKINWLNLGVGINVNNHPGLVNSCSIKEISGIRHDRKNLLTSFEDQYKKIIKDNKPSEIRRLWKQGNLTLDKEIILKSETGDVIKGVSTDIDAAGSLLIKDSKNKIQQALFGDIYIKETAGRMITSCSPMQPKEK